MKQSNAASALRLTPSLRDKVWGKKQLLPWFPDSGVPIGEAWFLADRELPLLVKLLFTAERLSVQVHPDDGDYGERAKNEMWHVLEAAPGAAIALGFRRPIARETLWEASRSGEIDGLLNWMPVQAGETYFTPAHTVHAIGPGLVLCEIQQNSDITYRLWDYGRPRPIQLEKAAPIADLGVHPGPVPDGVVRTPYFVTEPVRLHAGEDCTPEARNCQLWTCLEGRGTIGGESFGRAEVWLMPEEGPQPAIRAEADSRFLRTWLPG